MKIDPIKILSRLHNRYESKHDFNCICRCEDSTICKCGREHTVDVWVSGTMIKFLGDDGISYETEEFTKCPVCGRYLQTSDYKEYTMTNGMRVI